MHHALMKMLLAAGLVVALLVPLPARAQEFKPDLRPVVGCNLVQTTTGCRFYVTVTNTGLETNRSFTVRLWYDNNDMYFQTVNGLVGSVVLSFPAMYSGWECLPLHFSFVVRVDVYKEVSESDEWNNAGTEYCAPEDFMLIVPDVRGDTTAEAAETLEFAGFAVGRLSDVADRSCTHIDRVVSQDPAPGVALFEGVPVNLTLGKQPPPPYVCP